MSVQRDPLDWRVLALSRVLLLMADRSDSQFSFHHPPFPGDSVVAVRERANPKSKFGAGLGPSGKSPILMSWAKTQCARSLRLGWSAQQRQVLTK